MKIIGIILMFILIMIIAMAIVMSTDPSNNVSQIGKINNKKEEILNRYPNSKYRLFTNQCNDYLIIDKNNHVIIKNNEVFRRIEISDILAVNINYEVLEKNKMKVLTIVPTFDKQTILKGIKIEIHAKKGSTIIESFDNRTNLEGARPQIERFKYLVEDIKNTQQNTSNIEN